MSGEPTAVQAAGAAAGAAAAVSFEQQPLRTARPLIRAAQTPVLRAASLAAALAAAACVCQPVQDLYMMGGLC